MNRLRAALGLFSILLATSAAGAEWAPDVTLTAEWNSNVTNADRASDVIGALALRGDVTVFAQHWSLGRDDALSLALDGGVESWLRFDGLDRLSFGPRAAWQHKFGLGALAPVLRLELSGDRLVARNTDRTGYGGSATLLWRQRFESGLQLTAAYARTREDAREALYDRTAGEGTFAAAWDVSETWTLSATARWRIGDVLSYATPPRPDLVALARDREEVDTFGATRVAYAVSGHTLGGSAAASCALDERSSVTFAYEYRVTDSGPLRYVNHLVSVSLNRQF